jgi:hypothetical protein
MAAYVLIPKLAFEGHLLCLREPGKTAAMAVFNIVAMKSPSALHTMHPPISFTGIVFGPS